jgi:hypothetical protein
MQKFIDQIQQHPLVVALVVFVLVFIVYNVIKKPATSTATAIPGATPTGTGVGGPTGSEVYASQNYQYPTYNAPVVQQTAPAVSTTPTTVPAAATPTTSPAPASQNVYHGILSVIGSEHPANIGPWIPGRQITFSGQTYTLVPGAQGRLWGIDKSTGQQVNLWDGNDWGPLGGQYGKHTLATTGVNP